MSTLAMMEPAFDMRSVPLTERAMTVGLHISMWNAQRLDRAVTSDVLTSRAADKDAGRFDKFLVPRGALEDVRKAATVARATHYSLTLPWGDEGVRIMSSEVFFVYSEKMKQCRQEFDVAVRQFLYDYPKLVQAAPARLGQMYSAKEFPSVERLKEKFGFRLHILPVPDKDDFRVSLGHPSTEAEIRESIEETVKDRFHEAQNDLWMRLLTTVKHFATTMAQEDKVFRDSTYEKLVDIALMAPHMSLARSEQMAAICQDILSILNLGSSDALRSNLHLRADVAEKGLDAVRRIEAAMEGAF